jgi:hypothetical protein
MSNYSADVRGAEGHFVTRNNKAAKYQRTKTTVALSRLVVLKTSLLHRQYTVRSQNNGAVSKVNNKFVSHLTRAQHTPSVAATIQVSHVLPVIRFSCLLRDRGASFQDGVAAGKGYLCAPF